MTVTRRSLSEIRATAQKAARGAGCCWGMAEEAGFAARLLEAHDLAGVATVDALLAAPRACACAGGVAPVGGHGERARDGRALCGLAVMARLSDGDPLQCASNWGEVAGPLLLAAALLVHAQRSGRIFELSWPGGSVICAPEGCRMMGALPAGRAAVSIQSLDAAPLPLVSARCDSRAVPASAWQRLEDLAARTYVPETEASRAAGAGPDAASQ